MKSKWLATVVILSLGLNLALAGYILGARSKSFGGFDPTRQYIRWARHLPESRRADLRPIIRGHFSSMRPHINNLREGQKNLRRAVAAEPFTSQLLEQTLQQLRKEHLNAQKLGHKSFVLFVQSLTPDERRQLAADLGKRSQRHHRKPDRLRMENH